MNKHEKKAQQLSHTQQVAVPQRAPRLDRKTLQHAITHYTHYGVNFQTNPVN